MHKTNKDSALSNQNVKSFIEKKILEADQKPLAPALQLILGKYLEHVSNYSFPHHFTFLQTEATDVQMN